MNATLSFCQSLEHRSSGVARKLVSGNLTSFACTSTLTNRKTSGNKATAPAESPSVAVRTFTLLAHMGLWGHVKHGAENRTG